MAIKYSRGEVVERLSAVLRRGEPIIGAGAGIGLSAKCEELGGADLIIIYNTGRFRMNGLGSPAGNLAYGDANATVLDMGERILPVVKETPVICGVNGTDPTRDMGLFLKRVSEVGFSGVINCPMIGRIDGNFRKDLESIGLGFHKEVEMIRLARDLDLFTMAYVFQPEEARKMAEAGVDIIVAHMGLTAGGSAGAKHAMSLKAAAEKIQELLEAAKAVNPQIIPLSHGGPISTPRDAAFINQHTDTVGFVGASSIERIPVEKAIREIVQEFKHIPVS